MLELVKTMAVRRRLRGKARAERMYRCCGHRTVARDDVSSDSAAEAASAATWTCRFCGVDVTLPPKMDYGSVRALSAHHLDTEQHPDLRRLVDLGTPDETAPHPTAHKIKRKTQRVPATRERRRPQSV